jgi:hypothetical protein
MRPVPFEYPPMSVSVAQGLATAGRSPVLLVTSFLAVLLLWAIYSSYGSLVAPSPAAMVLMASLPPVHNFLDLSLLTSTRTAAPAAALGFGVGLIALRAILGAFWVAVILGFLEGETSVRDARAAIRRAGRAFVPFLGVEAVFSGIVFGAEIVAQAIPGLGQLLFIAVLMGGAYFFVFAPVIAVSERTRLGATLRLAREATRSPNPRHMMLVFTYVAITLLISALTPSSFVASATPSLLTWCFALFITFLHMSFLAAFAYRWLVVREKVIDLTLEREASRRPRVRS